MHNCKKTFYTLNKITYKILKQRTYFGLKFKNRLSIVLICDELLIKKKKLSDNHTINNKKINNQIIHIKKYLH